MSTARLDSKFAQHAKTDAGNMAFLAILLGANTVWYLITADVWWQYVVGILALLYCAVLARRGVARYYVIGVLVNVLRSNNQ